MELILVWRNPTDRRWYPVARIDRVAGNYRLRYLKGILYSDISAHAVVPGMDDREVEYRSPELFPFLKNRVYNRKRSDYDRKLLDYRCRLTAPWPEGFTPYSGADFQPLVGERQVAIVA